MFERTFVSRAILAIVLFFIVQLSILWYHVGRLDDKKLTVEAEIDLLERKRDLLRAKIFDMEKNIYRFDLRLKNLKQSVRDVLPLTIGRRNLPMIYFITPTYYRPSQKADLTRLSQTLAHVPKLHWIVIEDSGKLSESVSEIIKRSGLSFTHLHSLTPSTMKMTEKDPSWKFPRGVSQRNAALGWLRQWLFFRTNLANSLQGVVYFGDDDNVYDLRLFSEMREIEKIGVWPVGIVGGLLVETPIIKEGKVASFNSIWKPNRMFPIDMAAFAINISLVLKSNAVFTYEVPRGYQESHFLKALSLNRTVLEPKANNCKNVLVWHTRTEKVKLAPTEQLKFREGKLSELEVQAVG